MDTVIVPRPARAALGLLAVLLLGAAATDLVASTQSEARLAHRLSAELTGEAQPTVEYAGAFVTPQLLSGKLSGVRVSTRDVELPNYGLVTYTSDVSGIYLSPSDILRGNVLDHHASLIRSEIRLDALSLGSRLGLSDLEVRNDENNSPLGGWEDRVVLSSAQATGTDRDSSEVLEVRVALRITPEQVEAIPEEILSGGDDLSDAEQQAALERFAFALSQEELPLPGRAMRVYGSGGNIVISSERFNAQLQRDDLLLDTTTR